MNTLIQLEIGVLLIDTATQQPVVMLKDLNEERALPIVIGLSEAGAIASEMERLQFPRPMTHDLLKNLLDTFQATLEKIVVCDLRENTFYAQLHITKDGEELLVDARPSDAIALALRAGAAIYACESVIDKAAVSTSKLQVEEPPEPEELHVPEASDDAELIKEFLEGLREGDFGKYKM
ncbi:MAG: hypothetical protein AUK47_16495 [Deltaproteobacteria bacterium CG2_30_63_29]|nr:MAG: hypothetical protein AUK47_16495 [Deltaproteobacteria bacterium CG2_30_63_29]PJB34734.1 MAG: hypothetical protein CO108_27620 [Deltaproteobacteria bacterium CG_4_9_14_3_um_filter_63_12]